MGEPMLFNGIDATTGNYATPPVDTDHLAKILRDQPLDNVKAERQRLFDIKEDKAALRDGYDPKSLAEAGWGILFLADADPALIDAFEPLISHRRQLVDDEGRFRVLSGEHGYRAGDTKMRFLTRAGVTPVGPVDPNQMPYYLLIVGSPSDIPFEFQYQLDVAYAVGRLHFEDVSGYRHYAESVVRAEAELPDNLRSSFLGTATDPVTQRSATDLVAPLVARITERAPGVSVDHMGPEEATKDNLAEILGDGGSRRLVFTASHGMDAIGRPDQQDVQGALICQEWPGLGHPPTSEHVFAAADVDPTADYTGLVAFLFACYGAGTPQFDNFPRPKPKQLAEAPFLAALPKALLGSEAGGALAVVGHVDRAWTYSFDWPEVGPETAIFEDSLLRLLNGYPVGYAMEMINERAAELAVMYRDSDDLVGTADQLSSTELVGLWTAKNDSRNYAILGDPAARLA